MVARENLTLQPNTVDFKVLSNTFYEPNIKALSQF